MAQEIKGHYIDPDGVKQDARKLATEVVGTQGILFPKPTPEQIRAAQEFQAFFESLDLSKE